MVLTDVRKPEQNPPEEESLMEGFIRPHRDAPKYGVMVDTETGGIGSHNIIEPFKYALLEIGAIVFDIVTLEEVSTFSSVINPYHPWASKLEVEDQALGRNKFTPESLIAEGDLERNVVRRFNSWLQPFRNGMQYPPIFAWNKHFDISFIRAAYVRSEVRWPFTFRSLDVQDIWAFGNIFQRQDVSYGGMEEACRLTLKKKPPHRALEDCYVTLEMLRYFLSE